MTGYGSATVTNAAGEFSAEIRSVNNRYLDLNIRLPRELGFLELPLRSLMRKHVHRGKVDLFVRWIPAEGTPPLYEINRQLLRHYLSEIREATDGNGIVVDPASLLQLPGVVNPTTSATENENMISGAEEAVAQAIAVWDATRCTEGHALAEAIRSHLRFIADCVAAVEHQKATLEQQIRLKLAERVRTLAESAGAQPEASRLEIELGMLADRLDITEELVRLRAHLECFELLLTNHNAEPLGKRMDFLTQELAREVNTIGSKVRGIAVVQSVLDAKNEIEKIREQVQNLE